MIKKFKHIYPQEEIIDGFSILCFESLHKLKKFSSSINKNVQRMILNEINRSKSDDNNNNNRSIIVSDNNANNSNNNKLKIAHHLPQSNPISPTRITAQRKSKPDMNALSLAICCQKRRNTRHGNANSDSNNNSCSGNNASSSNNSLCSPVKTNNELRIDECEEEHESQCWDKENEAALGGQEATNRQERIDEIQKDVFESTNEYCPSPIKEESCFAESSLNATSTLSPVSFQPSNGLQGFPESMDLDSPTKVDIDSFDTTPNTIMNNIDSNNNISDCNANEKEYQMPLILEKNQDNQSEKDQDEINEKREEDDCMITSVGFDPSPKLSCIPLSTVEHLLVDIPKLKPAPPFVPSSSIKTILLQNFPKSPRPPPLIPAPSYYFLTNCTIYKTNSKQNTKSKSISHKPVVSPKLKSPKRSLMKSSILKSSSKCVKVSSIKNSKSANNISNPVENMKNPVVRSILQNSNHSTTRLYSINTLKNSTLTPAAPLHSSRNTSHKSQMQNISISENKRISKHISKSHIQEAFDNTRGYELMSRRMFLKQSQTIRKTINHVDIAHWISKKIYSNNVIDRSSINFPSFPKPKSQRQIFPPPCVNTVNANEAIIPDNSNHFSFNFHHRQSSYRIPNKFLSVNNSFKQHNDSQILIRPLNSINTSLAASNTVFLNSALPNTINYCSRPNLLLLQ